MKGIERAVTLAEELKHVFVGTSDKDPPDLGWPGRGWRSGLLGKGPNRSDCRPLSLKGVNHKGASGKLSPLSHAREAETPVRTSPGKNVLNVKSLSIVLNHHF